MTLFSVILLLCCIGSLDATLGLSKRQPSHHLGHADHQHIYLTCFEEICDDHRSSCLIHRDHKHAHGHCEVPEHCDHHPECTGVTQHDHQCCCKTADCVNTVWGTTQQTYLNCGGYHCVEPHQTCIIDKHSHGGRDGWCADDHHCNDEWECIDEHGHETHHDRCCCRHQNCISALLGSAVPATNVPATNAPTTKAPTTNAPTTNAPTTVVPTPAPTTVARIVTTIAPAVHTNAPTVQTTPAMPLYCPVCADDFTADCQMNAKCKVNEGCMLQVVAGKLKTGCAEINDCEYHERIGDSICCHDKNCTDHAFTNMHSMSYTCPSCQNSQDPNACMAVQSKCSYLSKGCMITHNSGGISSGCNTHNKACHLAEDMNSVLCNVHPIPFAFQPALQCSFCCHKNANTCILDALGIHDVSTPPPTMAHTAGTTASTSCVDLEDPTFSCKNFDATYHLCKQTSGLMAQLAVTRCRKTCGICGGTGGVISGSSPIAPVTAGTTTIAATSQTTTQCPCVDHDMNNNCVLMSSVLCATQNSHARNYAIANCAKTCNLCNEYCQHLSGLTVPGGR